MKNNKGFSLVELVIVIAIMAILVGVAVPVYSTYVEKSKKAMDKDLVAGVMDAVKKGTYSQMFVNNDSFKMGSMSYPVGFIVLTKEGAQVLASSTSMSNVKIFPEVEGDCELVTLENVKIVNKQSTYAKCTSGIDGQKDYNKEIVSTGTITYCKSHTPANKLSKGIVNGNATITTGYQCTKSHAFLDKFTHSWSAITETISADIIVYPDELYLACGSSSDICEAAYANELGIFGTPHVGVVYQGNPLYDAIVAAYGNNFSDLKLSYDKWTSDEGFDFATFYTSAPQLMSDMKTLSGLLATGSQASADTLGLSQIYASGEEVLIGVADTIASTFPTLDSWMAQWNNDSKMTWDSYGFGLTGRENYSAVRMAYNNAFASYLATKGVPEAVLKEIREFYSQKINLVITSVGLPGLVCTDAFTDSKSELKNKLSADDFALVKDLYKEYIESDAFIENGKLVYNTLVTFNDTSAAAEAYTQQYGGSIFDYYNKYVNEISTLYTEAKKLASEGIIIIVTVTDGELDFVVSPSEADPRKG